MSSLMHFPIFDVALYFFTSWLNKQKCFSDANEYDKQKNVMQVK